MLTFDAAVILLIRHATLPLIAAFRYLRFSCLVIYCFHFAYSFR